MAGFRTQYTRLNSNSDDPEEDLPPQGFDIGTRGVEEVEKGNHAYFSGYTYLYIQAHFEAQCGLFTCTVVTTVGFKAGRTCCPYSAPTF